MDVAHGNQSHDPSDGILVGHWDADTLVWKVRDSIPDVAGLRRSSPHRSLRMTERFKRRDFGHYGGRGDLQDLQCMPALDGHVTRSAPDTEVLNTSATQ